MFINCLKKYLSGISEEPDSDGAVTRHGDDPCLARAVVAEGLAVRAQEDESIDVVRAGLKLVDYLCKMINLYINSEIEVRGC